MLYFEWHERKAELNRRKHGVSFDAGAKALTDERALAQPLRIIDGEYDGTLWVQRVEPPWSSSLIQCLPKAKTNTPDHLGASGNAARTETL